MVAQTFVSAPYYIRTVKAGFESVDPQYEGVAATLGASPLRIFWRIMLPLSWPSVLAGAILCWARALGELGATLIFAGNFQGRTQTMPLAIIGVFDAGRTVDLAIALSVILVVSAAILLPDPAPVRAHQQRGVLTMLSVDFEKRVGNFHSQRLSFAADDEMVVLLGPSGLRQVADAACDRRAC